MTVTMPNSARRSPDALAGERAHMLMWTRGESQGSVADAVGMERTQLGRKLRGARPWYLSEIVAVARHLGTSVAYLTGETDDPMPSGWAPRGSNPQPTVSVLSQVNGHKRSRLFTLRSPGTVSPLTIGALAVSYDYEFGSNNR